MPEIKIIKVFEDRQQKVKLSPQNMDDLLAMRTIIGENNIIIQADGKLLIRHYVGYVQLNKTRLLVYPKIAIGLNSREEYDKSFEVMIKMLVYSDFLSIKKAPEKQQVSKYQNDILELYIALFVDELTRQFQRDVNKGYNNQLENQSFIKGKVDFNETIKKNSFKKHLHYVRYDEFNENTLMNQIFKAIIQTLIQRTRVKQNKIKLKQLFLWLEDVPSRGISEDMWNRVILTRQNKNYEAAFNMARLFYYNSSPTIREGETAALSFLVPVNQLFEKYLFKILDRNNESDYDIKYQGPIKYLANVNGKSFLQLKPDIIFMKNDKTLKIIDAKYKIVGDIDEKLYLQQSDVYQMLAYSVRYQCNDISLIYPKILSEEKCGLVTSFTIQNYDQIVTIQLIKIDLEEEPEVTAENIIQVMQKNN